MQNIQNIDIHIRMLSGEIFSVSVPELSITLLRNKLYDQYVGKNGRNEVIRLFYEEKELLSDDDLSSIYTIEEEEKKHEDEKFLFAFIEQEKKMKPEETKEVEQYLMAYMKDSFTNFQESIITSKALVAGGSILATFGKYRINDLDIYVHYSNAQQLIKDLCEKCLYFTPHYSGFHQATQYDQSFFRKNNILSRFCLRDRTNTRKSIDVMVIPDDYPIEDVVTNFDLSFCEVWWDGKDVYANDPYGVRTKSGILKPDYRQSLFQEMNMFIIRRMQKYRSRGFKIDIGITEFAKTLEQEVIFENVPKKSKIAPSLSEAWAISKFLDELYKEILMLIQIRHSSSKPLIPNIIFSLFPQQLTYQNLLEKIPKEMVTSFAHFFMKESSPRFFQSPYKEFYTQVFPGSNDQHTPIDIDERIAILSTFLSPHINIEEDLSIHNYKQSYRNLNLIYRQQGNQLNDLIADELAELENNVINDIRNYQFR